MRAIARRAPAGRLADGPRLPETDAAPGQRDLLSSDAARSLSTESLWRRSLLDAPAGPVGVPGSGDNTCAERGQAPPRCRPDPRSPVAAATLWASAPGIADEAGGWQGGPAQLPGIHLCRHSGRDGGVLKARRKAVTSCRCGSYPFLQAPGPAAGAAAGKESAGDRGCGWQKDDITVEIRARAPAKQQTPPTIKPERRRALRRSVQDKCGPTSRSGRPGGVDEHGRLVLVVVQNPLFRQDGIVHRMLVNTLIQGATRPEAGTGGPGYSTVDQGAPNAKVHARRRWRRRQPDEPAGTGGQQFVIVTQRTPASPRTTRSSAR